MIGMRASELATALVELIDRHGDCRVILAPDEDMAAATGVDYQPSLGGSRFLEDTFIIH